MQTFLCSISDLAAISSLQQFVSRSYISKYDVTRQLYIYTKYAIFCTQICPPFDLAAVISAVIVRLSWKIHLQSINALIYKKTILALGVPFGI